MNSPELQSTMIESDHDLLRFALHGSVLHWHAWVGKVDIDKHSHFAYHLFPTVYKQLLLRREEHPWIPRLKGVYRRQWSSQKLMLAAYLAACRVLEKGGIDYLEPLDLQLTNLLDDPAIFRTVVPRFTVRSDQAPTALNLFLDNKWSIDPASMKGTRLRTRLTASEWQLIDPCGNRLVLTERYQKCYARKTTNEAIWSRSYLSSDNPHMRSIALSDLYCAVLLMDFRNVNSLRWAPVVPELIPTVLKKCIDVGISLPDEFMHEVMRKRLSFLAEHSSASMSEAYEHLSALPVSIETRQASDSDRLVKSSKFHRILHQYSRWDGIGNFVRYLRNVNQ